MTNENPYQSVSPTGDAPESSPTKNISPEQATYNMVSDTVIGVNARKGDNLFQAVFILASILLAAIVGAACAAVFGGGEFPWYGGALVGSFLGLIVGFFLSGLVLMVYRAVRHAKGIHD